VPIVIILVPVGVLALPVLVVVPVVIAVVVLLGDHDRAACPRVTSQGGESLRVALLAHACQGGVLPTREANAKRESEAENESAAKAGQDHDVPPSCVIRPS
jgi:hypothetical protein